MAAGSGSECRCPSLARRFGGRSVGRGGSHVQGGTAGTPHIFRVKQLAAYRTGNSAATSCCRPSNACCGRGSAASGSALSIGLRSTCGAALVCRALWRDLPCAAMGDRAVAAGAVEAVRPPAALERVSACGLCPAGHHACGVGIVVPPWQEPASSGAVWDARQALLSPWVQRLQERCGRRSSGFRPRPTVGNGVVPRWPWADCGGRGRGVGSPREAGRT